MHTANDLDRFEHLIVRCSQINWRQTLYEIINVVKNDITCRLQRLMNLEITHLPHSGSYYAVKPCSGKRLVGLVSTRTKQNVILQ